MSTAGSWRNICATGAGVACAVIGITVLAGWNLQSPTLIRIFPQFGTMQPNAAIGLILCGAGLVALQRSHQRLAAALGGLTFIIGLLTLAEHYFRLDLHIDKLFVGSWPDGSRDFPLGKMSSKAALCLALAGAALAVLHRPAAGKRCLLVVGPLSALVAGFGIAGVAGYFFQLDSLHQWHEITEMSLRTAIAFVFLGSGLLIAAWEHCAQARGRSAQLWLPFLAAMGMAAASWVLWAGLVAEERSWHAGQIEVQGPALNDRIDAATAAYMNAFLAVADRWSKKKAPSEEQFSLDARFHAKDLTGFQGIGWADTNGRVLWISPRAENEELIGRRLLDGELFRGGIRLTAAPDYAALSHPVDLSPSGNICLLAAPILKDGNHQGFVVGVLGVKAFFDGVLADRVIRGATIAVYEGKSEVYRRTAGKGNDDEQLPGGFDVSMGDGWFCRIWPTAEMFAPRTSILRLAVLVGGHLIAALLALTISLAQTAHRRASALLDANRKLEGEVKERQRAEASLRAAHDELEARVKERTAELSSANAELKSEMVERRRVEDERERLLVQLEAEKERLAEADRRKTEFLAILGHELRNPLGPIINTLEAMRVRGNGSSWKDGEREVVERQVKQLARLVDDLLDVSRITRGQVSLRKERVDLAKVVSSAVEAVRPLAENGCLKLDVRLPPGPLEAIADPARIEQALDNLLNNAVKFTDPGGRISLRAERVAKDLIVRISDTGIGLAPEMIRRIFEPFTQASHLKKRGRAGLGIGLTIVKSFVEMHGGSVAAKSDGLGKGSEFQLRLPLLDAAAERDVSGRSHGHVLDSVKALARRVFIVDDNVDSARTLQMLLQLWGHEVEIAHDGETALHAVPRYDPSLLFLDIELPGMNGYEVAQRLREEGHEGLKIIALTGYGQEEDRRRASEAGIDVHLVKPVEPAVLQRLLAEGR